MIGGAFAISGILLLLTALLFGAGLLTEVTQTVAWLMIFFFASAAASHRQRNISFGNEGLGHRLLLCAGNRDWGEPFTPSVWLADRVWIELAREHGICAVSFIALGCRGNGMEARDRRGR
jgi:hypothetical protein